MMIKTNFITRDCPLCGSNAVDKKVSITAEQIIESSPYYNSDSYEHLSVDKKSKFSVSNCQICSFVFAAETPSENFLNTLYSPGNIADSVKVFARPSRAAYAFRTLSIILDAINSRSNLDEKGVSDKITTILDVGCAFGVGSLGLAHSHFPYKVFGVEWSSETRGYLSSQGMTPYKSLEEIPPSLFFDGILLNDVLEHVSDPIDFLNTLLSLCHEKTVIWVNVPNFINWRLKNIVKLVLEKSQNIPTDFNPWEHLSYFSPSTLDVAMSKIGAFRVHDEIVDYPINRDGIINLITSIARLVHDMPKLYRKKHPSSTSTSAVFEFKSLTK